jgi:hypothetical protein
MFIKQVINEKDTRRKRIKAVALLEDEENDEGGNLGNKSMDSMDKKFNYYDDMDELGVEKEFKVFLFIFNNFSRL